MAFPDTGPRPDGTRSAEQWLNAMAEDVGMIRMQLRYSLEEGIGREAVVRAVAIAQKEASRLLSDVGRFGKEVHRVTKEDLDGVGPL